MRVSVSAGLLACALTIVAMPSTASANTIQTDLPTVDLRTIAVETTEVIQPIIQGEEPETEEVTHTVKENDSLSKIATEYDTTWKRIFDKNVDIENPDFIEVDQVIIIPKADEELEERLLPENVLISENETIQEQNLEQQTTTTVTSAPVTQRSSSSGNLYTAGYCTWYVKNRRPDLPNNLGNASTWVSRAAAQGIPTGSTPRVGAVGQKGNHVVYVEGINGDGTITISDMNYQGLYQITTRTVPASSFSYIY